MNKKYKKALFIFRRDLRLEDNTALNSACKDSETILPVFIFDPCQIDKNRYKSQNAINFMLKSLDDLDQAFIKKAGKLFYFEGRPEEVLQQIIYTERIDAVFINKDYTPFSTLRDEKLSKVCRKNGITFKSYDDALLAAPGDILKKDGKPYKVFTPFYKAASKQEVRAPEKLPVFRGFISSVSECSSQQSAVGSQQKADSEVSFPGGRKAGLKLLKKAIKLNNYSLARDFPAVNGTSYLSAHNKFGTISIREVYHAISEELGDDHTLIQELYWRDFFTQIAFYFPHVFKGAFNPKYDHIIWENDEQKFNSWCEGKTGFPIVDAGMRELNFTGFMHNRVRMITASFLVKDLHIDWRWGEKYFANKLIDYDPAVNNGNWQWAASTGCDAQPYFRIFNPWRQQEKFDKDGEYIKKWVSELKNRSAKDIHKISTQRLADSDYIAPIVDHKESAKKAVKMYQSSVLLFLFRFAQQKSKAGGL